MHGPASILSAKTYFHGNLGAAAPDTAAPDTAAPDTAAPDIAASRAASRHQDYQLQLMVSICRMLDLEGLHLADELTDTVSVGP